MRGPERKLFEENKPFINKIKKGCGSWRPPRGACQVFFQNRRKSVDLLIMTP